MSRRLHKHKLLLDENLSPRTAFPRLNGLFDVKHVREDFQRSGLPDPQVYDLAVAKQRVLVSYNVKHFQPLAGSTADAGIIGISANLPSSQIDTKLTALLTRSTPKRLAGTFTTLTGETEAQLSLHLASQLSATSPCVYCATHSCLSLNFPRTR